MAVLNGQSQSWLILRFISAQASVSTLLQCSLIHLCLWLWPWTSAVGSTSSYANSGIFSVEHSATYNIWNPHPTCRPLKPLTDRKSVQNLYLSSLSTVVFSSLWSNDSGYHLVLGFPAPRRRTWLWGWCPWKILPSPFFLLTQELHPYPMMTTLIGWLVMAKDTPGTWKCCLIWKEPVGVSKLRILRWEGYPGLFG